MVKTSKVLLDFFSTKFQDLGSLKHSSEEAHQPTCSSYSKPRFLRTVTSEHLSHLMGAKGLLILCRTKQQM